MSSNSGISGFLESCKGKKILVIGDLMLDRYFFGKVNRISPEAPVPIVDINREESRPGGAANVALNIIAMGGDAAICGVVGTDKDGEKLGELLEAANINSEFIFADHTRRTSSKIRIIGNDQHTLRVDREDRHLLGQEITERILEALENSVGNFDAIVFEEYDKGMLRPDLISRITGFAEAAGIPVAVDPKYDHFWAFTGVTLFKPNLKELNDAMQSACSGSDMKCLTDAISSLRDKMPHQMTLVTTGADGMVGMDKDGEAFHIPAKLRKVRDVSGAGDTVIAALALGLAAGVDLKSTAFVANIAGGLVCEEVGVVPVSPERLQEEINSARP